MSPSRWSSLPTGPGRPVGPRPGLDAPPPGRLRRDLERVERDLESGPDAAMDRVLAGTCRIEGVPAEFAATADLLGDAAAGASDATGSRPGGCTGCSSRPTR